MCADCKAATSAPAVFTPSRVAITAPVAGANDVPFNPVVAWTPCENGTEYTLEISTTENFSHCCRRTMLLVFNVVPVSAGLAKAGAV